MKNKCISRLFAYWLANKTNAHKAVPFAHFNNKLKTSEYFFDINRVNWN